jgi:hypothetical protein
MQFAPIRLRNLALAVPLLLFVTATASACGQVTGLSNDYLFDLAEAGGGLDANGGDGASSADAPKGDAVSDAAADSTSPKCSATQVAGATARISQMNGLMACKQCLADSCCTDIEMCTNTNECKRALSCRLDCTTLTGTDRHDCFNTCNSNSGGNSTPALFTSGVGACNKSSCDATCAFL